MKLPTLQIQAVLYKNDPTELVRSLDMLAKSVRTAVRAGVLAAGTVLRWGDASPEAIYSEEQAKEIARKYQDDFSFEYIYFNQNTGYGLGNNMLASGVTTDYLMISNAEVLVGAKAIADMLLPFEKESVGIVEARQLPIEHPKEFNRETYETGWSSGACFMIRRALFEQLSGFDAKTFFMYCEDVDLSWRVRMAGKTIYYQTLAGVFHARRTNVGGKNETSVTERKYTLLAEALLAWKWGWPEYARQRIACALRDHAEGAQEAAEAFGQLESQGALPTMLDPEHQISQITQDGQTGGLLFSGMRYLL